MTPPLRLLDLSQLRTAPHQLLPPNTARLRRMTLLLNLEEKTTALYRQWKHHHKPRRPRDLLLPRLNQRILT
jgi:hypothetical protein